MGTRLEDLDPAVMWKARGALEVLERHVIPYVVTSTRRTLAEQQALFAQGRQPLDAVNALRKTAGMAPIAEADNGYTVTKADGVTYKSNHQSGRALDVVPANENGNPIWPFDGDPRWQKIADVMKAQGFTWGGDWTQFPDMPHYEVSA